jgi:hypothetical protein
MTERFARRQERARLWKIISGKWNPIAELEAMSDFYQQA